MADAGPPPAARPRRRRRELWAFVELFALCGFVVVQPLLETIGNTPHFFIFHGVGAADVLLLVALLVLVPPIALWTVGRLVGLAGPRARRIAHVVSIGGLLLLFAIQLGKHFTGIRGVPLVALAVAAAGAVVAAYVWLDQTGQLLRFAAVGPPVFVLLFTFASPASAVVFGGDAEGAVGEVRATGPHPPVVMIVFDEFPLLSLLDERAGIDAERYPNFARLAGDATWYRNATAMAGWTPYALPAMLSGREPSEHVAPHYSQHPENLFTLFGEVYQIRANESISELCPPWHCGDLADDARGGLPVALAETATLWGETVWPRDPVTDPYADFVEPTVAEQLGAGVTAAEAGPEFRFDRVGDNQPARFQEFLTGLAAGGSAAAGAGDGVGTGGAVVPASQSVSQPTLHFLHLLLPHTPWTYLPSGVRYYSVPGLPVDGQWWGRLALQRHELQLEYTDRLLGETLRALEETGVYDDALIVVTADHGVSLTPGTAGRELKADSGTAELAWVPLFIKQPGQDEGVVDDRNWQHVDLLPTMADLAGIEVPWQTDGISAVREQRSGADKVYYNDLDDRRVLDGPVYFDQIRNQPGAIPPVPEAPLPELIGRPVSEFPITEGTGTAEVDEVDRFAEVDPDSGFLPALVHGWVPKQVVEGTSLAIAVNGRIGAVVPVVAGAEGARRFAGLVEDETLFVPGENRLEVFLVSDDGGALQRVPLAS